MTRDERFTRSSSGSIQPGAGEFDVPRLNMLNNAVFNDDDGLVTAEFDPNEHDPTLAIVEAVATAGFCDPLELTPISYRVDGDALDDILTNHPAENGRITVSLRYEGYEVTVTNAGEIRLQPIE